MTIPRDPAPDASLSLLREGYAFIPSRSRRFGSDVFETRILMSRVVCMTGAAAARAFYHPGRFTRRGALPSSAFTLIQDRGSVMALDDEAHHARKEMFLSIMRPDRLGDFAARVRTAFLKRARSWSQRDHVVLFQEANLALCDAVCGWAGLQMAPSDLDRRTSEFAAMIDGTGSIGPRNWRGHIKRARSERWARRVIEQVRSGRRPALSGCAVDVIARFQGADGQELDLASAAVELINVLRPTVANARYVVFAAMALRERPDLRLVVAHDDDALERFVQEVRRFYPFIPFMAGRVLRPFAWNGRDFAEGEWVMLDLYGTNRDARHWENPEMFDPGRFRGWRGDPYSFIPSGGGAHEDTHRCPGEWMTVAATKAIARALAADLVYDTPLQDLEIQLSRIPALPSSGFVMTKVRETAR